MVLDQSSHPTERQVLPSSPLSRAWWLIFLVSMVCLLLFILLFDSSRGSAGIVSSIRLALLSSVPQYVVLVLIFALCCRFAVDPAYY
jgi:hypothetical protein